MNSLPPSFRASGSRSCRSTFTGAIYMSEESTQAVCSIRTSDMPILTRSRECSFDDASEALVASHYYFFGTCLRSESKLGLGFHWGIKDALG